MKNKVVLITGGLTGIGRATALAFAQEGASIVVSGRHDDEGQKLVGELRKLGAEAEFVRSDVRHEDDVRNLVDKTVARFGRLDVAVNNAGTEGKPGPVTEQSAESYAATFDTNVLGTLLSMKHELARDVGPGVWEHRQRVVYLRPYRRSRGVSLRGQQARGGRPNEVGGTRGFWLRCPSQCGRSWSNRYRYADQVYRQ